MTRPSCNSWHATWNRAGTRVAIVAASLAAGVSMASPGMSDFRSMDANGDGRVSAAEHTAAAQKMFDAMDANRDGRVTAAEHEVGSKRMFEVMDTNRDGFLSEAELNAAHAAMLKKK